MYVKNGTTRSNHEKVPLAEIPLLLVVTSKSVVDVQKKVNDLGKVVRQNSAGFIREYRDFVK